MTAAAYPERPATVSTPALFGRVMALVALTVGFATLGVWLGRELGRPGLVHRLAALHRLPDRLERGQLPRPDRPGPDAAVRLRPADRRQRRDHRQLLLQDRPDRPPPGVRGDGALRRGPRSRGIRGSPRSLVPLPDRLRPAPGAAGRGHRADLRPHPGRVHGLVARRPCDLRALHRHRLQSPAPGWQADEAIPLAAGIFLDVLNIFLFFLRLFARSS